MVRVEDWYTYFVVGGIKIGVRIDLPWKNLSPQEILPEVERVIVYTSIPKIDRGVVLKPIPVGGLSLHFFKKIQNLAPGNCMDRRTHTLHPVKEFDLLDHLICTPWPEDGYLSSKDDAELFGLIHVSHDQLAGVQFLVGEKLASLFDGAKGIIGVQLLDSLEEFEEACTLPSYLDGMVTLDVPISLKGLYHHLGKIGGFNKIKIEAGLAYVS